MPSRPTSSHGPAYRIGWWLGRVIVLFLAVSVGLVVVYRFVPVPVTATMIMDPNGFDKTWVPLDQIDRNTRTCEQDGDGRSGDPGTGDENRARGSAGRCVVNHGCFS